MLSKYFYAKIKSEDFQEYIKALISEAENKRVLIYGAGQEFAKLNKKYEFNKLDIIGFSDRSFKKNSKIKGLLHIPPDNINEYEYDIILIMSEAANETAKYLIDGYNVDKNKIKLVFKEEIPMERDNYNYLESFNFGKHIKNLTKKLKNKTIVLYGAGTFFEVIKKYYDISGLNIIGISDKRFELAENDITTFLGYKTIKPDEIKGLNPDYVLVTTKVFIHIIQDLMLNVFNNTDIKVRPLVKKSFFALLKEVM